MNSQPTQDFINFDHKSFAQTLDSLSPLEYATLACVLGIIISPLLTLAEQNSYGNFLQLIGQFISTVNAQGALQQPSKATQQELNEVYQNLNAKINYLMSQLGNRK